MTATAPAPVQLLTVDDVAAVLRLSPRSVRRMIEDGRLPVIRLGRAVRVHPSALSALVDNSSQEKTGDD